MHKTSFWAFIFNFNCLHHHYYLQYLRLLEHGPNNFVRGRKKSTKSNLSLKGKAEKNLSNDIYSWREFLKVVSHTSDNLSERLQQEFSENEDLLLQDAEIPVENTHQLICTSCNLNIQERFVIAPCGDSNVCGQCIDTIRESNLPICPTCGQRFENVIRIRQM